MLPTGENLMEPTIFAPESGLTFASVTTVSLNPNPRLLSPNSEPGGADHLRPWIGSHLRLSPR